MRHTLGPRRGAGGINENGPLIRVYRRERLLMRIRSFEHRQLAKNGTPTPSLLCQQCKRGFAEAHPGLSVIQDEFDLRAFESRIDRDGSYPGFKESVEELDGWDGVRPMDSYPIASLQSLIQEPLCQRRGRLIQCLVRYLSFVAEQCYLLRAPLRMSVKSVT